MQLPKLLVLLPPLLAVAGCVSTAIAVVKAPFQIVGAGVDALTTSQSEADRNRGRKLRKAEEAEARADKAEAKARQQADEKARRAAEKAPGANDDD